MTYRQLLLAVIIIVSLSGTGLAQQTQTLCTNQSNPSGWVTIHISTDFGAPCPLIQNNLKVIEQISTLPSQSNVYACNDGNPIPDGWVITTMGTSASDCGEFRGDVETLFNTNGMPLGSQVVVCYPSSPIPTGWSILGTGTNGQCSTTGPDAATIQRISGPDLSLSASPPSQTIPPGSSTSYQVAINRINGFADAITLSASSVPNATITFNPNNTTGSSSTMTVTTNQSISLGSLNIVITGVSGAYSRTTSVNLTIQSIRAVTTAVDPIFNTMEVDFIGADAHVHQLSYNGAWSQSDLSAAAGAPNASTSGPGIKTIYNSVANSMEVHYIGADQHVHTLWSRSAGTWYDADISAMTGAPFAALNSPITAAIDQIVNSEEVEYIGPDHHVHQLFFDGAWHAQDLTTASGAAPNADPSSGINTLMNTIANSMEVWYIGTDEHTYALWFRAGGGWRESDLTALTGAPLAKPGTPLTSAIDTIVGSEETEYVNTSQHVQQLWFIDLWHTQDLTLASGAANLASNGGMHTLVDTIANTMEVHYVGTDQHVYALWYNGAWHSADLTITTGAPPAVAASPLTSAVDTVENTIDVEYVGTDQHIHQLWFNGSWHTTDLTATAP